MILWVDDDGKSLEPFIDELEEADYKIEMAYVPERLLECLEEKLQEINCIIMDIMMPTGELVDMKSSKVGVLTGLELLKILKANPEYKSIPVLIFTILKDQEVVTYASKNGMPLLVKQETLPLQLLEKIREMNICPDNQ